MDLGLAGQVVAVFGAARGIGEAIAGAFMVAHAFTPMLVQAGAGTLLFIASVAAQIGSQSALPIALRRPGWVLLTIRYMMRGQTFNYRQRATLPLPFSSLS